MSRKDIILHFLFLNELSNKLQCKETWTTSLLLKGLAKQFAELNNITEKEINEFPKDWQY